MPKLRNVSLVGLDFDQIKSSLKSYLQSQSEFEDYNFEGSALSTLLNVLAYNTHYQSYYLNMVANEMFLDSARTRGSVVSHASALGYTPLSSKAPQAELSLSLAYAALGVGETRQTVIDKYTEFLYTSGGTTYTFLATDDFTITDSGSDGSATITVKEGIKATYSYIYDSTNVSQKLEIPSSTVDIDTLRIEVYDSATSTSSTVYTKALDISSLTATSTVYFVAENMDGNFEIYFGDNVIGANPTDGSKITMTFIETNETLANGAGVNEGTTPQFSIVTELTGWTTTATVSSPAAGGAERQSIDQIRLLAPMFYESQDRAVTVRDYESIVQQYYPNTDSLRIYGGEDVSPPEYGKVFVAIKPIEGSTISAKVKSDIVALLREKNIITITPEVVDADTLYVTVNTKVYYDPRITSKTSGTILSEVVAAIQAFADSTLEKFNRSLFHSKFTKMVDDVNTSIAYNDTSFSVYKKVYPTLNASVATYSIKFGNALYHPQDGYSEPVISSESFVHYDSTTLSNVTAYFEDDGSGNIRLYKVVDGVKTVINSSIGTVNYETGVVTLATWLPVSITSGNSYVKITATPRTENVLSSENIILTIDASDITTSIFVKKDDVNKPVTGY